MRRALIALTASASVLALSSCGLSSDGGRSAEGGSGPYPVTVENCGADVTLDAAPEKVVLLKSAAVPYLSALGVLDRVSARAGEYPRDYYDDATWAALEKIPALTGKTDTSGHLLVSKEVVIGKEPDLVLGEIDNLSRATLDQVGIPLIEEPAMCPEGLDDPGFDDVYAQMETYGKVFDRTDEAAAANAALKERVAELSADGTGERRTAAVLYPTVGGGVTYAYGTRSMAHPILEAAGLDNVFADTDERVFEVTPEELIGRDPDVLILLHSAGDPAQVAEAITRLPGARSMAAVRDDNLMPLLFNYVEPPTPLALDGLAKIQERFGEKS
ncbi:ABC transporter substrate-binding protein [Pimelobacter simplex]|uniref:ABC transporter (Iron.B12.siderophore.hemin), periplasmic substrate-binding component n=1 Tax=Nocardioides simplex TaxID=2045 RepID=A0A0A1DN40_NOCSI|nr:ABC transporter substrate-binding protein [Pimelobacter simplex]AIY16815.1 ABC transporter (iron.B12.siderophore.hemin), periplasmic substrate-binding component [Pimelobacter simplex]MCG8151895.1 ABC transporter substrate-binding protein [Pimelobacter simplex]GEB12654.1 ABC transporter substrate-binding protein [Pimelobacter simplex]SFM56296.1 iron complex transport system substrate-binding protein [Pimelobacter simplex]